MDALTRRQNFAEDAFLSLYRSIDDAPDPLGALQEAAAGLRQLQSATSESAALRQQLSVDSQQHGREVMVGAAHFMKAAEMRRTSVG